MIKNILPRSLFARSMIILITPIVVVQMITTFVFFDNHWSRMTSRLGFAIAGEISIIADLMDSDITAAQKTILLHNADEALHLNASVVNGETLQSIAPSRPISKFWDYAIASKLRKELSQTLNRPFVMDIDTDEKWVDINVQIESGVLNVRFPGRRLFSSSGYIVILWMIGTSLLLLSVAIIFMRNQIKPIRKLAVAAERFGKGGDVPGFKPSGAREVRRAAEAFMDMNTRIRRQIEQRTAMLAGVSHDLRTPLTRLKLQTEMMKKTEDVTDMRNDITDMERMIEGYLDFARGAGGEASSFTNLSDLVQKSATLASDDTNTLTTQIEDDVYLMLKPMAMQRCLNNIIENAKQYGTSIIVTLSKSEDHIAITIEDDGPGIPAGQTQDVFKPFYRMDPSRHTEHGHVGLGLSIAQDIVHTHGGEIHLGQSDISGLKVSISLPV